MKHTQGQWLICEHDNGLIIDGSACAWPIAKVDKETQPMHWRANARLIASAPQLLKALEEYVAEWDFEHASETYQTGLSPEPASLIMAREAIARATGESGVR